MNANLNYAIVNTSRKYGFKQAADAIFSLMIGAGTGRFTTVGRDGVENIAKDQIYPEVFKNYVEALVRNVPKNPNEFEYAVLTTYQKIEKEYKNKTLSTPEEIMANNLVEYVINGKREAFTRDNHAREGIKKLEEDLGRSGFGYQEYALNEVSNFLSRNITEKDVEKSRDENHKLSRVKVKNNYIGDYVCSILDERAVFNTDKMFYPQSTDKIGKHLQVTQSVGAVGKNQEDAVLIMQNENNPKYKMMVIADGMGGSQLGEEASKYIVENMREWYKKLGSYDTRDPKLAKAIDAQVEKMNKEIFAKYNSAAQSTFLSAIIDDKGVLVTSVGDSKAFISKDNKLFEVGYDKGEKTNDGRNTGSLAEAMYEMEYKDYGVRREDMRFFKNSNVVLASMGAEGEAKPATWRLDNDDYDRIIIGSDGVFDCLSLDELSAINKNTSPELISKALVQAAVYGEHSRVPEYIKNDHELADDFYSIVKKGKDNTSAAVYDKKLEDDRDDR